MKRSFFVLAILFALVAVTTPTLVWADSEYDAALHYYYKGRYEEAVKYLKEYVERKPDPSAYYLIGYSLYELGRYKEANQYFEEAYLVDPNFSPEKSGLTEKFPKGHPGGIKKPSAAHKGRAAVKKKKKVAGALTKRGGKQEAKKEVKQAPSAKQPPKETQPKKAGKPEAAAGKTTPQQAAQKVDPKKQAVPQQKKKTSGSDSEKKAPTPVPQIAQQGQKPEPPAAKSKTQKPQNAAPGVSAMLKEPMIMRGVIAGVAAILLGVGLIFFLRRKRKAQGTAEDSGTMVNKIEDTPSAGHEDEF